MGGEHGHQRPRRAGPDAAAAQVGDERAADPSGGVANGLDAVSSELRGRRPCAASIHSCASSAAFASLIPWVAITSTSPPDGAHATAQ